ncbi:bacterioferritin-associated ferredoxin [Acetobacter estunensis]|uniref:(2Fe-2S)-binding protein n=1 Tax=Acetobacter estunensis TaxID=104097 RepID=UPI001C2CEEBB|nr:(2Fe-2S)-binding protein [Acetobacter estunensis]MBV1837253.1 (2Fe-2S)-binding protein [Acetobacter estunensis]
MYVCACNGLTDKDVHDAVDAGARKPGEVYAARKCRAQCGNCVKGVVCLLREAMRNREAAADLPALGTITAHPARPEDRAVA